MPCYLPTGELISERSLKEFHSTLIPANIQHDQLSALEEVWRCHPARFAGADGSAVCTHSPGVSIHRRSGRANTCNACPLILMTRPAIEKKG